MYVDVETSLDPEAVDLLTTNATSLMSYTEATLNAAERAILKVPQSEMERLKIVPERKLTLSVMHDCSTLMLEERWVAWPGSIVTWPVC